MVCCWSQASQGQGTDQLTLFWPQHSSLPRQGLMKAFNKEEYGHQRASLPFQVPCLWSFLPPPSMPSLALASLRAAPSSLPGSPRATAGLGQSSAPPSKVQGSPPTVSPSVGSATGVCHPHPVPRPPWSRSPRHRQAWSQDLLGPRGLTCAHWHGGLACLQRQAAEPGRMTSQNR